jgi:hypothetical protein
LAAPHIFYLIDIIAFYILTLALARFCGVCCGVFGERGRETGRAGFAARYCCRSL